MSFNNLPAEILADIGSRLRTSSLLSLGSVNRAGRAAAVPSIYPSIAFYLRYPPTLASDFAAFDRDLEQAGAFRHVRSLHVKAIWGDIDEDELAPSVYRDERCDRNLWRSGHTVLDTAKVLPLGYYQGYTEELDFEPLARVLKRLTGLERLIFDAHQQFPCCLLSVLHESLPTCKLEIRRFSLRSLRDDVIDPYEAELATSSSLTSVHTHYSYLDELRDHGNGDLDDMTILDMVSRLAPKLQEVRLFHKETLTPRPELPAETPGRRWRPFLPKVTGRPASLETLELTCDLEGKGRVDSGCLARWAEATDLSSLRQFRLANVDASAIQWLSNTPSLEKLTALQLEPFDCIHGSSTAFAQLAELLTRLRPLQDLVIKRCFNEQHFNALLTQQDNTAALRRLDIFCSDHVLDQRQIVQLLQHCPHLWDLSACVRRSLGDRTEYEVYRSLGRFPRLHSLALALVCESCRIPVRDLDDRFDAFENEPYYSDETGIETFCNGQIMKSLLNGALDESLAVSIWDAICAAKPPGSMALSCLSLGTCEETEIEDCDELDEVIAIPRYSWRVEWSAEAGDSRPMATLRYTPPFVAELNPRLEAIVDRVWPGIFDDGKDWKTSWWSQPLWRPEDEGAV